MSETPDQPTPTLQQRVEWLEQSLKDAGERLSETVQLYKALIHEMQVSNSRLNILEDKMRLFYPEVENCPKCHRKVSPGARRCGVCNHVW